MQAGLSVERGVGGNWLRLQTCEHLKAVCAIRDCRGMGQRAVCWRCGRQEEAREAHMDYERAEAGTLLTLGRCYRRLGKKRENCCSSKLGVVWCCKAQNPMASRERSEDEVRVRS